MRVTRVATILVASGLLVSENNWPISSRPDETPVRQQLIGAWRLVSDEEPVNGKLTKLEQTGILTYTSDGHMSVQIMDKDPKRRPAGGPVQYSANGYEGYFGTFDVNETAHSVTHHVQGALVRSLIGKDLTRIYTFSGKQLVLKSSRPDEDWRIVWEHY
jgi:lipocalin-like protein